ncbi:MAG: hypothetical protein NVS3B21_35620 [Acidimicrobiales bacterium]
MTASVPTAGQIDDLDSDECRQLLSLSAVGRIGFVSEGLPIVLPVNYRLLSDDLGLWIILRTRAGSSVDGAPEHVAFEIDYDRHQGWSVLVRGTLHHLDHNEVELLSQRFDPKPWPRQDKNSWLAIKPTVITGRRLGGADREWELSSEAYL